MRLSIALSSSLILAALLVPASSQASPKDDEVLPLKRLRLYETGVGYFERRGKLPGNRASLPLPAAHLDDALKSLVVLGEGEGTTTVTGVSFPSAVSEGMGRALAGLPTTEDQVPLDEPTLLRSLTGLDVVARTANERVRGRLVEVLGPFGEAPRGEVSTEKKGPPPPPTYAVLVVTEKGAIRRFATEDLVSIGPAVPDDANRLHAAVGSLASTSARKSAALDVDVAHRGRVALGYIAEAPVWRTSYRVVLADQGTASTLQAWALVHNDTDEDWDEVSLELVNGQPTSFLFPLAAPRYERRELREPERPLSTVPQLARSTVDAMFGDLDGEMIGEAYGVGGLGLVGTGYGGGGSGVGTIGLGTVGTLGAGGASVGLNDLAEFSQASTESAAALFHYHLPNPVDLAAHHSALVPVVTEQIEAESIVWVPPHETMGATAARVVNSTRQTLPGGTVAFFARGGFAGEATLPRLKPSERTFAGYGRELDVEVHRTSVPKGERRVGVQFHNAQLIELFHVVHDMRVEVDNRDAAARKVYVGLPVPRTANVEGAPELDYDARTGTALMVTEVPGQGTSEVELHITEPSRRAHALASLDARMLENLASDPELEQPAREVLREAAGIHRDLVRVTKQRSETLAKIGRTESNLERLRESMMALKNASADRSARQLARQILESELSVTRHQGAAARFAREEEQLRADLTQKLGQLGS